jgi:hypothetical protein
MLELIRSQQIYAQSQAIAASRRQPLATYQSRDTQTGDRILAAADGGKIRAIYRGSTELPDRPSLIPSSALGVPGQIP